MNLHRTNGKSDWEKIDPGKYNSFQKLAAETHGLLTPANIITIIGLGTVLTGLVAIMQGHYWTGLALLIAGRLLDIVDGSVAEKTGTKSSIGEIFDASADKIGTILTIFVLVAINVANWWIVVALILPQIMIPIVVVYKKQNRLPVHPTLEGKLSMAFVWMGIIGLIVMDALNDAQPIRIAVYLVVALSLTLGLYALWQYATGRDQD